jgi:hypothetical protein
MKKIIVLVLLLAIGVFLVAASAFISFTIPEPASMLLVGSGLVVIAALGKSKLLKK